MSQSDSKKLRLASKIMLVAAAIMIAAGAYTVLVADGSPGILFMGLGSAFAALAAALGAQAKKADID